MVHQAKEADLSDTGSFPFNQHNWKWLRLF